MEEIDKPAFVQNFARALEEAGGDTFFTTGVFDIDYDRITEIIKTQGYWKGARKDYYFDEHYNIIYTKDIYTGQITEIKR